MSQQSKYRGMQGVWRGAALVLFFISCFGCGPGTPRVAAVKGKVLLNGQPLTTGRVLTQPAAGRGANGLIDSNGNFELSTYGKGDGALVGTHHAAVVAYENEGRGPEGGFGKLLVPERYATADTSGLTIDVEADGTNAPVIELTAP